MATNEYTNVAELIKDYYDAPVGSYLNKSISINNVTLTCDVYRVANNTVLTSSVFTGCTGNDANTQIIIGNNMSVASGTTLIPPYRCKGVFIGDVGTFTNSGTISMTARGASGEGKNIQLTADYMISAVGGSGATSVRHYVNYDNTGFDGDNGNSPSSNILSCGGGGSGSVSGDGGYTRYTGAGGNGTSFSGGAGGGACTSNKTSTGYSGSSTGGSGGKGIGAGSRGGAGNPKGADDVVVSSDTNGTGTGGLIVVLANSLISSGNLESKGSTAPGFTNPNVGRSNNAGGGASGGGCIVLISRINNITGTTSVAGGSRSSITGSWINRGGAGGAGVYASYIVEDLILQNLPVEIAISDTNHLDNIEPSEGVRLLGMMDDDELYYEIMGTRHSSGSGHILEDEEGTALTKRKALAINSPLTVEDDSVNEKTDLGVDTDADLSSFPIPQGEAGTRGVPVGTVISFFGDSAPDGYLACNGAEYNKADYTALSAHLAALSTASQYAGSTSDKFKVPDLQGEFLRGSGTNSHTNQGSGSTVGSHQDATEIAPINTSGNNKISIRKDSSLDWGIQNQDSNTNVVTGNTISATATSSSLSNAFAYNTTRPTNTSVMYCIKY